MDVNWKLRHVISLEIVENGSFDWWNGCTLAWLRRIIRSLHCFYVSHHSTAAEITDSYICIHFFHQTKLHNPRWYVERDFWVWWKSCQWGADEPSVFTESNGAQRLISMVSKNLNTKIPPTYVFCINRERTCFIRSCRKKIKGPPFAGKDRELSRPNPRKLKSRLRTKKFWRGTTTCAVKLIVTKYYGEVALKWRKS